MAGQRGYTSFGKEHAKQSNVADLKRVLGIGRELPITNGGNGFMSRASFSSCCST
jgi:hypothetical protein